METNLMNEKEIIEIAKQKGFFEAAFMDVKDLVIVPEYRKYCEENLCGCYNKVAACPPQSGTVAEMTERVLKHKRALVLQTLCDTDFKGDPEGAKEGKKNHNMLADQLINELWPDKEGILRMTAGPWKGNSCMSAYCVDVQKMADHVGMVGWANDGKCRFFSQILL